MHNAMYFVVVKDKVHETKNLAQNHGLGSFVYFQFKQTETFLEHFTQKSQAKWLYSCHINCVTETDWDGKNDWVSEKLHKISKNLAQKSKNTCNKTIL